MNGYDYSKVKDLFVDGISELIDLKISDDERKTVEHVEGAIKVPEIVAEGKDAREVFDFLKDEVYPYRMHTDHKDYYCYIPNPVSPYAIFGDMVNTIMNPYGGSVSMSPVVTKLETNVLEKMAELIGYDVAKAGGNFVSGGSMGNLTAAELARDEKLKGELAKGTVYMSDQAHSSLTKSFHTIGVKDENIKIIVSDDEFKIDVDALKAQIKADVEAGLYPFMIVGNAGSTNTGSIDPLPELAEIAKEYDMWFHVDGAYGAGAFLSSHRDLLRGAELSDSVSWDAHKWLFQPYSCSAIIVKDKMALMRSFCVHPEYLEDANNGKDVNLWDLGIELTRPSRGAKLWYTLQVLGLDKIREMIDHTFELQDVLMEEIKKYDDFEVISGPNLGIINIRYVKDGVSDEELDEINHKISEKVVADGTHLFLTTTLKGKTVLRFCNNNPKTQKEDIISLMKDIRQYID